MTLTMPLDAAAFFRAAPVSEMTWDINDAIEVLTLGGGEVLTSDNGVPLWRGSVTLASRVLTQVEDIMALVRALRRPGASFFATPLHQPQETLPAGATLLAVSGRTVRFAGLPAGTVLARGTFFSFSYGSSPTRYAFHQLGETVTADGSGNTAAAEVVAPIRPGYTLGVAVVLIRPRLKAVLVPGSAGPPRFARSRGNGATFDWVQTLR